jgi:hypothetical protein
MACSCERGNELTAVELLDKLSVLLASEEGLCCMELVSES